MKNTIAAVLLTFAIAFSANEALSQEPTTNARFIGLWRNSQNYERCKYFPAAVLISMVNESRALITFPGSSGFDKINRPKMDSEMLNAPAAGDLLDFGHDLFRLSDDNTIIFTQIGPDGRDNCNFIKAVATR